jgi:nucleotide-binding universal stress UspA family protein
VKILIAVDDSPDSERAVEFVTRMRWPAGSRVIVMTAWQPIAVAVNMHYAGPIPPPVEHLQAQRRRHRAVVDRTQGLLRAVGFSTEGRIMEGDPRECLMEIVKDLGVDLLVMGSHGRGALGRALMGSVSSHAVTHIPCSVLVVKHPSGRC